jgi:hypothetical protein
VLRQWPREVDPVIDFFHGNNKNMTISEWVDRHERCTQFIAIDKCAWDIPVKNVRKESGHYR